MGAPRIAEPLALASLFPQRSRADWAQMLAAVVSKARGIEVGPAEAEAALTTELPGGLRIDPLYQGAGPARDLGVPGRLPFTRGAAIRDAARPWDVRAFHDDPDAALTRQAIRADLDGGATSVWLQAGTDGLAPADIPEVLDGTPPGVALVVSSVDAQSEAAGSLLAFLDSAGHGAAPGSSLGCDPLAAAARVGAAPDLAPLVQACDQATKRPGLMAMTVDSRVYADAGADDVDEVALALATGLAYLRHLESTGVAPAAAAALLDFRLAAGAEQFVTAAKLRALRRCWSRIASACGVDGSAAGARIHAVSSRRMLSLEDPSVNILRSTLAVVGAVIGGADAVTVLPHDTAAGLPEPFSRRVARNTQVVLRDEAAIGAVTDPAGGSWFVEDLTEQLATRAWAVLQEIERRGGLPDALRDGWVSTRIGEAARARQVGLDDRSLPLTGVSMFPDLASEPSIRRPRAELAAVSERALPPRRDAAAFEALRARSRALGHPVVTLRPLGSARQFAARETFAVNLLAAGGLGVTDDATDVVLLVSDRDGYAEHLAEAVAAARAGGARTIWVTGRRSELGEAAPEVDADLYDGMNVVDFLDRALRSFETSGSGVPA